MFLPVARLSKPRYSKTGQEPVFNQLRREVSELVKNLAPRQRGQIVLKAILFPTIYFMIYVALLIWGRQEFFLFGAYSFLGILLVVIFLNVIHDAVHETVFRNPKANRAYVYLFDLMGANSFIWKLRHVRFHHNYPNVNGWDTDIEQSNLFRVFPTGNYSSMHKYQHIYLPLLYPFYLANWLLVRDFRDFLDKNRTVRKFAVIPKIEYVRLFFFKSLFLFYLIVLPKIILGIPWFTIFAAFALMLLVASCFSLLVLLSPHANTESHFPVPSESNELPYDWMTHMMVTTNDISNDNWFIRFFMGCFNYHIVHHLFPNIHHTYYPEITRLLKKYSKEYSLPYREFSLWTSLRNHYRLLKHNSIQENIFEETM